MAKLDCQGIVLELFQDVGERLLALRRSPKPLRELDQKAGKLTFFSDRIDAAPKLIVVLLRHVRLSASRPSEHPRMSELLPNLDRELKILRRHLDPVPRGPRIDEPIEGRIYLHGVENLAIELQLILRLRRVEDPVPGPLPLWIGPARGSYSYKLLNGLVHPCHPPDKYLYAVIASD